MKKGFTLIELLVVIAIIALLAATVLASLQSARSKAADTSIKEQLATIKTQSHLYYEDNSVAAHSYGDATTVPHNCTDYLGDPMLSDAAIGAAIANARKLSGDPSRVICYISPAPTPSYVISIPIKSNSDISYCIESPETGGNSVGVDLIAATDDIYGYFSTKSDGAAATCGEF